MNLLQRFTNRFRRNQRVYVFFVCFLIATLFWFLLVLTKDYSSSLNVKVAYTNFPSGFIQVNRLPEKFLLNIKASGYNLISMGAYRDSRLNIDVAALVRPEPGKQKISSRLMMRDIAQQLGNDVSVISIQPDTITFDLNFSTSVKLPIKANLDISFDRQYDSVSSAQLTPDSVTVTMPASFRGSITRIETERIHAESLRNSLKEKVNLLAPESVYLDTSETEVFLQVEKFTEAEARVPVNLVNIPAGLTIKIYPDKVLVKYLVSLSHFSQIKPEMFTVTADATSASSDPDEKLPVQVITAPAGIRSITCQPPLVDFILKK